MAAGGAVFTASQGANYIERRTEVDIRDILDEQDYRWAEVEASGLQVIITGEAPDEAVRFAALSSIGTVVDAARIIDRMEITRSAPPVAPRFSIEVLRTDQGISLIGLVPASFDRDDLLDRISDVADGKTVSDLLETAEYPIPDGWENALDFGLDALETFDRSKISVAADRVAVFAAAETADDKTRIETRLSRNAPDTIALDLQISAPRPVLAPFTLRFLIDDDGPRFDACAADSSETRSQIITAATDAGIEGDVDCTLGLGMPSPRWAEATAMGINAVAELGAGSITYADTDVTLIAQPDTPQAVFDRVAGALDRSLPPAFSLHAILPEPLDRPGAEAAPEFVATRSPEGLVQLRGRVASELLRDATESYAISRFGRQNLYVGVLIDEDLPDGWSERVLAGLQALTEVNNGAVVVQQELVEVRGNTGNPDARARISRLLSEKLGEAENYTIDVTYQEALDPIASLLDPEECLAAIQDVQSETKITFEPSLADVDELGMGKIDQIAEILQGCHDFRIEIGGHTDSQGREIMNQQLSKERAEAVRSALVERRTPPDRLVAVGYGEAQPIATNETEEGRELNRRIVFSLIVPEPVVEEPTGLEMIEAPMPGPGAAPQQNNAPAAPENETETNE